MLKQNKQCKETIKEIIKETIKEIIKETNIIINT